MALIRWGPRRDLINLREAMDNMCEDFFGLSRESTAASWSPDVDVLETKDEYTVALEAPGLSKGDIKISLQDNVLVVKGEKREGETQQGVNFHRCERCWGSFRRSFSLPSPVQADKVGAVYKDGVLTITVPKAEEAKAKEIPVVVK